VLTSWFQHPEIYGAELDDGEDELGVDGKPVDAWVEEKPGDARVEEPQESRVECQD